jgi:hypothetical protein
MKPQFQFSCVSVHVRVFPVTLYLRSYVAVLDNRHNGVCIGFFFLFVTGYCQFL